MKHKIVLLAAIAAALLCGCQSAQQSSTQETTAAQTPTPAVTQVAPTTEQPATGQSATDATQQSDAQTPSSGSIITEEEAKGEALGDAGLTEVEVTFTECKLETDDGVQVYEIEFVSGSTEYDYKIDAATGTVLEKGQEKAND